MTFTFYTETLSPTMNILILEDEELAARQSVDFLQRAGLTTNAAPVLRSVE